MRRTGRVIVDGIEKIVYADDVIKLPVASKHIVIADEPLKIIEVRFGRDITVDDKIIWQEMTRRINESIR